MWDLKVFNSWKHRGEIIMVTRGRKMDEMRCWSKGTKLQLYRMSKSYKYDVQPHMMITVNTVYCTLEIC